MTKLKPVFLLICKDDALLSRWIERNRKDVKEVSFFRGSEVSWNKLYEEAMNFSLFSPRRLIVVREAQEVEKEGEELFLRYLSAPNPGVFFLLVAESLPSSGKVFKVIAQKKLFTELKRPVGKGLYKWIEEEVREFGKEIEDGAISILAERFPEDLESLKSEIEKLVLYVGDRKRITESDVREVVSSLYELSPFELLDSIFMRDSFKFIRGVERSFISKEPPIKVISTLAKYLRVMLFLSLEPHLEEELLRDLHPFFASKIKRGASLYAPQVLSLTYKRFCLVDDMVKKGRGNPYDLLLWAVSPLFKREKAVALEEP